MRKQRKTLIKPHQVLGVLLGVYVINCAFIMCKLTTEGRRSTAYARELYHSRTAEVEQSLKDASGFNSLDVTPEVVSLELPVVGVAEQNIISFGSVEFRGMSGSIVTSGEVEVNASKLLDVYTSELVVPDWDVGGKINTIAVLWEFLVNEAEVPAENAAGILGSVYCEGNFGEQQGTGIYISNIQQARELLGDGGQGYGCAQWTYRTRQRMLLKYYEMANEQITDDWDKVRISAECAMLLEEIKGYDVFINVYIPTSIEDATGRVGCIYEKYDGYNKDWDNESGIYSLVRTGGSGAKRLEYARYIYDYFME